MFEDAFRELVDLIDHELALFSVRLGVARNRQMIWSPSGVTWTHRTWIGLGRVLSDPIHQSEIAVTGFPRSVPGVGPPD